MITESLIEQAVAKIRDHGANYVYFFQRLESPEWIEPLWRRNFFKAPPLPKRHEGGGTSYPLWVESQYLLRVVERAPDVVAEVIKEMPETENVRVHRDILEIIVKLSPDLARTLVPKVVQILK